MLCSAASLLPPLGAAALPVLDGLRAADQGLVIEALEASASGGAITKKIPPYCLAASAAALPGLDGLRAANRECVIEAALQAGE